jgi:hypothetical protein
MKACRRKAFGPGFWESFGVGSNTGSTPAEGRSQDPARGQVEFSAQRGAGLAVIM